MRLISIIFCKLMQVVVLIKDNVLFIVATERAVLAPDSLQVAALVKECVCFFLL